MNGLADVAIVVLVFATLATAWSWLGAHARVVSFGHAVFFGIGAYAVAVSNLRGGSPWYGAVGGALFAVVLGASGGLLCLRGRGWTFSALTLIAGVAAEPFAAAHAWLGPGNVFAFAHQLGFLHLQFEQKWPYVLLILVVFGVAYGLTLALRASRLGFYLHALRTNAALARGLGVEALPPRLLALVATAFFTSVAGSFFAEYSLGVTPHAFFALSLSFDIALIGSITGPHAPWGPPLAAFGYVLLSRAVPLHPAGPPGVAVLAAEGAVIVLIALLRPEGFLRSPRPRRSRVAAGSPA